MERVRRLVSIAVVVAFATSPVAFAASVDCPTMRARALSRCCCPAGGQEQARLSCCKEVRESRVVTSSPRERTERSQLAPSLAFVARIEPGGDFQVPIAALSRALPPSTAGPPPLKLRI